MLCLPSWKKHLSRIAKYIVYGAISAIAFSSLSHASDYKLVGNNWISFLFAKHYAFHGNPFQQLQEQIDILNIQLNELSVSLDQLETTVDEQLLATLPVEVNVDCGAGESVGAVLAQYQTSSAPLTINISGVCQEVAFVLRGKVTLNGVTPDAGFNSVSPVFGAITVSRGAGDVNINNLTFTGGAYGVIVTKNSQAVISNVDISLSNNGILSLDSSNVDVTGSFIHDLPRIGLIASRGSNINVSDTTVDGANSGMLATYNSVLNISTASPNGTATNGVTASNNVVGVVAQTGGTVLLINANVNQNGAGILVNPSSSAFISGTSFSNNSNGVRAYKNSTVNFSTGNTISDSFSGIRCHEDTSYSVPFPPGTPPAVFTNVNIPIEDCSVEEP